MDTSGIWMVDVVLFISTATTSAHYMTMTMIASF